jgi:uncharacterized RDD family membrane protein YckC
MRYVGLGRRLVAAFVDGAIAFLGFGFAVAALTGNSSAGPDGLEFHLEGAPALAVFALALGYYVALEAMFGATIGKYLVGVRVRSADGGRIGWTASLARNLLRAIDVCFGCIGALLICTSPRRQRLGDRAANTVVVQPS